MSESILLSEIVRNEKELSKIVDIYNNVVSSDNKIGRIKSTPQICRKITHLKKMQRRK
jgi:hypothetical protein